MDRDLSEADLRADLAVHDAAVAPRASLGPELRTGIRKLGPVKMLVLGAAAVQIGMVGAWTVLPAPTGEVILRNLEMTSADLRVAPSDEAAEDIRAEVGAVPGRWHRWIPVGRSADDWSADLDAAALRPAEALRGDANRLADVLRALRGSRDPADAAVVDWVADEAALLLAALERQRALPPLREADLSGMLALIAVERG